MPADERKRQYAAMRRSFHRDASPALLAKFSLANDAERFLDIFLDPIYRPHVGFVAWCFLNHSHPIPRFVLNEVWYVKTVDDQPRPRQHPRRGKIQDMGREFTHRSIRHSLLPSFADDHISEFFRIEPHNTQNIFLHCGHRSRCFSWRKLTGSPRRQKTLSNLWCGVWVPSCGLWLLKLREILIWLMKPTTCPFHSQARRVRRTRRPDSALCRFFVPMTLSPPWLRRGSQ